MGFKIPNFVKQMGGSPFQISYDAAYDAQSDEKKASQSREEFKKAAKAYNKKEYGTTEPTKAASEGKITGDKAKKLIVEKLKAKKKREDVAKAKEEKAKVVKSDDSKKEIKVKTRKEKRSARRADRLKAKAKSKGSLTPGQKKRLERNEAKAKGEKPEKTKVGKALKSVVDKAKDLVSKDSPAKQTQKQKASKKAKTDHIKKLNKNTRKPGYVKHPTYTLDGEPLEYNPKYNPKNLITDQSKKRDKELMD